MNNTVPQLETIELSRPIRTYNRERVMERSEETEGIKLVNKKLYIAEIFLVIKVILNNFFILL